MKVGMCAMTYQSPIKRFRSTRRSIARKGVLEYETKKFDHDSQPEKSVASTAKNKDRPACIVIELRLFLLVIVRILLRSHPTAS